MATELHRLYGGKLEVVPRVPLLSIEDFSLWYTPGVAGPVRRIAEEGEDASLEYSWRWNLVAVVSDGSRVLGLGDVGPSAALPVMEGKCLLFKYLGGVDCVPLVVRAKETDEMVRLLRLLEPSFGGVNLEDIESPKCFALYEELSRSLEIPVWHDDQHGTATVVLAAVLAALRLVGKRPEDVKVVLFGAGAANIATYRHLKLAGFRPGSLVAVDSRGVLHREREDLKEMARFNPWKHALVVETNAENARTLEEAFKGADVLIAASRPGPGVVRTDWIRLMNRDPVVLALANPVPEIWPWEAKEAGARVVATGRSDLPNQVNNSLSFPAVFRGALTVRAKRITDEMLQAAAHALVRYVEETGLSEERIVPRMDEREAYVREAVAVAEKAVELGLARRTVGRSTIETEVREVIDRVQKLTRSLNEAGLIRRSY